MGQRNGIINNISPLNRPWKYSTPARADVGIGPYKGNELHPIHRTGSVFCLSRPGVRLSGELPG